LPDAYTIVYLLDQVGDDFLEKALRRAREKASDLKENSTKGGLNRARFSAALGMTPLQEAFGCRMSASLITRRRF
jgi:hypothetical protein